jgi:hypothetical protein
VQVELVGGAGTGGAGGGGAASPGTAGGASTGRGGTGTGGTVTAVLPRRAKEVLVLELRALTKKALAVARASKPVLRSRSSIQNGSRPKALYRPCPSSVTFPNGRSECLGCPTACGFHFK